MTTLMTIRAKQYNIFPVTEFLNSVRDTVNTVFTNLSLSATVDVMKFKHHRIGFTAVNTFRAIHGYGVIPLFAPSIPNGNSITIRIFGTTLSHVFGGPNPTQRTAFESVIRLPFIARRTDHGEHLHV